MPTGRLANPLFGVFARTRRGLSQLTPESLQPWVRRWIARPDPAAWWIEDKVGVALFRPELVVRDKNTGNEAVLCVRGSIYGSPRGLRASTWPDLPTGQGTSSLLYDILDRDTDAAHSLRGQFVFACWDGRRRRLMLARDHLGQRTIYVRTTPDLYIFCSELSPLLRPPAACELDPESGFWYLAFGVPPPGRTLAGNVSRLPAAHVAYWRPGELLRFERYWTPLSSDAPSSATPEVVDAIRDKLDESIARFIPRNGVLGILLSGGIDSSYLAATARSYGARLHAFTVAFERGEGLNENEYATAVAEWLGVRHDIVTLEQRAWLDLLGKVVFSAAEPCGAWAAISHFQLLARAGQRDISLLLSGLGSDEIFGGYDHFRGYYARWVRYQTSHSLPRGADPLRMVLGYETQAARRVLYPGVARFFDDRSLRRACGIELKDFHYASHLRTFYRECLNLKPEAGPMELMVAHECQHRIPDELFGTFEPITRRLSMEVAYPFLDPDLVRLVAALSVESRYRTRSGKFSLRLRDLHPRFKHAMLEVAKGRVPEPIRIRPRKSFTFPFGAWFCEAQFGRSLIYKLKSSRFWDANLVRREWLDHILKRVTPGPTPTVFQLWALLTLIAWFDRFVDARTEP